MLPFRSKCDKKHSSAIRAALPICPRATHFNKSFLLRLPRVHTEGKPWLWKAHRRRRGEHKKGKMKNDFFIEFFLFQRALGADALWLAKAFFLRLPAVDDRGFVTVINHQSSIIKLPIKLLLPPFASSFLDYTFILHVMEKFPQTTFLFSKQSTDRTVARVDVEKCVFGCSLYIRAGWGWKITQRALIVLNQRAWKMENPSRNSMWSSLCFPTSEKWINQD